MIEHHVVEDSVPGGKPKGKLAYPTDRILGGEVGGRQGSRTGSRTTARTRGPHLVVRWKHWTRERRNAEPSSGSSSFRWRHQELTHDGAGRGESSTELALTVHYFRGRRWISSTRLSAQHVFRLGARRVRWVSGALGCLHSGVLWCSAGWQVAGLRARVRRREGSVRAGGNIGEVSGRAVRSCRSPCGERHASPVILCT